MNFADRLSKKIIEVNSRIVVGLDPHLDMFPESILREHDITKNSIYESGETVQRAADAVAHFMRIAIDAVYEYACAVKLQSALYEALGIPGMEVMANTLQLASKYDLITIVDGKRGDIGSSMKGYLNAYFSSDGSAPFEADAITINPYMGYDVVSIFNEALIEWGKGLFVLVRTSNPEASSIQNVKLSNGSELFEHMAGLVEEWGRDYRGEIFGYSSMGAVVGLTAGEDAFKVRQHLGNSYLLMPGFGPQGGELSIIRDLCSKSGLGVLLVSSRAILFSDIGKDLKDSIKNNTKDLQIISNNLMIKNN
ncbi:MAG: orotidine-5'-phosphate decarboxylase [Candidatus Coatesbacteria bacterium]|nr:MAG: orotidine-5'-phosphate decarboxylase [Candidatus Coatesbacteria bacterium]